jgi:cytochrome c oxidase cbb3-type subunit 1
MGRKTAVAYAAQWYAVAALFLFPWFSSVTQLVLLWSPLRGVAQNVAAAWYAQAVWSLWLAPLALATAYYLVPKLSGRVLPLYEFARLGFWVLLGAGSWTGARALVGGPVPAWLVTLSIMASVLLMAHFVILVLNLRVIFGVRGTAASFLKFGLIAYVLGGVLDLLTAFRGVAVGTQFTLFGAGLWQLAMYGAVSMIFFAAIYTMVPRLTGNRWASMGLTLGHRVLAPLGLAGLVVALSVAGWTQGADLLNAKTPFGDIFDHVKLPLLFASAAQIVLLSANMLLLVNFLQTIRVAVVEDVTARSPIGREVSV